MADTPGEKEFNICLVGSGGVGTIAAVVLEKSGRAKVTAVLRSKYKIVKEKGFDIESVDHGPLPRWRPNRIVASITDATFDCPSGPPLPTGASTPYEAARETYDFLVLCTKQLPDQYDLATMVAPLITPAHTAIVLIQNGLNIHLPFIKAFPKNVIMSGVSMIGSFTQGDNKISHIGPDRLQIGPHYHDNVSIEVSLERTKTFVEMYAAGGARSVTLVDDMMKARYAKLLWNGTFNTICALMNLNVGEVQRSGARESLVIPIMRELQAVAKADCVILEDDLVDEMATRSPDSSTWKPSMLLDRNHGRPMEFEAILGDPIRRGKELGVPTPVMNTMHNLLKLVRWKVENPDEGDEVSIGVDSDAYK